MDRGRGRAAIRATLSIVLLLIHLAPAALAQDPLGLAPQPPTAIAEPAPSKTLRAELERLLEQLEDPAKAERLTEGLRAILEAGTATPGGVEAQPPPPAADDGASGADRLREVVEGARPAAAELYGQVEANVEQRVALVRRTFEEIYRTAASAPDVLAWARDVLDEPAEWQQLVREGSILVAILGSALLAMRLTSKSLGRARTALVVREQDRLLSRAIMAAGLAVLRALPILVFALVANASILALGLDPVTKVVLSSGVSAIVVVRIGIVLARAVLAPMVPQARLVPLSDAAATVALNVVHWFLAIAVYGQTLILVLRWYGLPWTFEGTLMRLIALILFVSAIWIVLRHRRAIGDAIGRLGGGTEVADWTRIPWHRIGAVWHVLAMLYLFALFVIYTIQGQAPFLQILGGSLLTLAVLVGLVVALRYVERTSAELQLASAEDDDEEVEGADAGPPRPEPHRPGFLSMALRVAILLTGVLTFLQVWGLGTWDWLLLTSDGVGEQLLDIVMIVVVTYAIWMLSNRFVTSYLRRLDAQTASARSSTRTRTVLVLARNALLIALYLIAGLVVLSEIGIDIAPLLAGAGVLGIAIGFGSQRLVQDVITGLFNLLEDTFAVGDVVDLGGKAGVVEAVTIRTVRLRDLGGHVHTIPFSAIDVVTNMTKDFAFAVFDVGVAYRENVDEVMAVIRDLGDGMRRERAYRRVILEPMEVLGVDQFADSAVIVKCRLKVRAGSQWMVGREFKRRLKNRFDELGIEIPFPHQTLYFGEDRGGKAPPARVLVSGAGASPAADDAPSRPRREEVIAGAT